MSQVGIECTLHDTRAALEEVIIENLGDQVPRHHSQSAVSGLKEAEEPPERLELLQILLTRWV